MGSFCKIRAVRVRRGARLLLKLGGVGTVGGFVWKFVTRGEGGRGEEERHVGTKARRWGPGGEGERADVRRLHLMPFALPPLRGFVPRCLRAFCSFLPLRKTGGVMRFGEHSVSIFAQRVFIRVGFAGEFA